MTPLLLTAALIAAAPAAVNAKEPGKGNGYARAVASRLGFNTTSSPTRSEAQRASNQAMLAA